MDKCLEKDKFEITTGERIKALRKNRNVTIQQLADAMGLSRQTITNYEAGGQSIPAYTLYRLSVYLKCDLDYLLGKSDLPTKAETDICKETGLTPQAVDCLRRKSYKDTAPFISLFIEHSHDIIRAVEDEIKLADRVKIWKECSDYPSVLDCFRHGEANARKRGSVVNVYYGDTASRIIEDAMGLYYQYDFEEDWCIGYHVDGSRNEENLKKVLGYVLELAKQKERYFTIQETFLEVVKEYIKKEMERREGMKAKVVLYEDETRNEVWVNMERGTELHQLRITAFYTKDKEETVEETVVAELIKREYIKKANEVEFCKANAERIV